MQLLLNDKTINIIIKRKKIKNIYFRFDSDNNLVVSAHPLVSEHQIEKMIRSNIDSIMKMNKKVNNNKEDNNYFYYLGNTYQKEVDGNIKGVNLLEDRVIYKTESDLNKFALKKCDEVFNERLNRIKELFPHLPEFSLKIRKMRTRWGVCNYKSNTVTLNSELIKKDVTLIDYVIIHELCHFKYHNHQKEFWVEVEKYYPYYKLARKRMKSI